MNKEDICFISACDMIDAIRNQELTSAFEEIAPWQDKRPNFD